MHTQCVDHILAQSQGGRLSEAGLINEPIHVVFLLKYSEEVQKPEQVSQIISVGFPIYAVCCI